MNDISIRKILVEYLKIKHKKHRIYQEKHIGSSICDVMLVTDRLIGFEIKSDEDNYTRLGSQIKSYEQYFDENYIVIGKGHKNSISSHVPPDWGIMLVTEDNITELRPSEKNKKVSRLSQLSLLWEIELKNILVRNNMSICALKSKSFIQKEINSSVDHKILGKQIAEELLERDYSVYYPEPKPARNEDRKIKDFPLEELVDRLSEENLSDFTLDRWMAIYQRAIAVKDEKKKSVQSTEEKYIEDRKNTKFDIPYTDIEVSLGVPWVGAEIIKDFIKEVFEVYYYADNDVVEYEPITGYWFIKKTDIKLIGEIYTVYGTQAMSALQILESTLNLREIKIYRGSEYLEEETLAALEKQRIIKNAFKEWVWKDADRRYDITLAYNKMFAKYKVVHYDGKGLEFAEMNPEIKLFDYQKNAVQKIISTPNTLLSFDVGAGKTYIMIAAAMEMRKSGLSRKNLFVVPNNIVGQWEKMFSCLYPKAKVLTVAPKSFTPEKRGKVLRQMQKEDYDGIIIAYSCFEQISLSASTITQNMQTAISDLNSSIVKLNRKSPWNHVSNNLSREIEYVKKTINDLLDSISVPYDNISFEDLGINTLFLDEAHNYKNIPLRSKMKNLRGINIKGSKKCLDMLEKVHYIQKTNGGRGVVFATGTPLSNSISDTYAMQCYLQFGDLVELKLDRFDNWAKTFALIEDVCEIDVNASSFRVIKRFTQFFNLPELSRMFSQVSIFHSVENDDLPELSGYSDIVIEKSCELDEYMQNIYKRTENIRAGKVDRKNDNMLKVSTDGRKAALSLNLVGKSQPYNESSKIYHCVNNVMKIYNDNPGCSQLIFCDYSTPKGTSYSVYKELKERLVASGIPLREIAFVHSCKNEEQKMKLYDSVNTGKVRVLIGSTFKLGIGANVQTKLKAIHHLDVPWRPADMVQREGRILRRGNENKEINIFRYIVEGSFDSYSWQILQTKQHFISQFLGGASNVRSIEDLENDELNYAQVKALALSEPLMKEYVEKENELRNAQIVYRQELAQKERAKTEIKETERKITEVETELKLTKENNEYVKADIAAITNKIPLLAEAVLAWQKNGGEDGRIGEICEFIINASCYKNGKTFLVLSRSGVDYRLELSDSLTGNKKRINNFFSKFDKQIEAKENMLNELKKKKLELTKRLEYSSDIVNTIKRLKSELRQIFAELSAKQEDVA